MESRILRQEDGFPGEFHEFFFPGRASGVDELGYVPVEVWAGGEDVAVHGPVVVLAEGEAVGGVIVAAYREGNEVGGIDEGDVTGRGKFDPQAAGSALMIVDLKDLATESGAAAVFGFVLGHCSSWWLEDVGGSIGRRRTKKLRGVLGEVAGDKGLAHLTSVFGQGDEELEAIGEAGVDQTQIGDPDFPTDGGDAIGLDRQPEAIPGEVAEREVGIALVVVFPHDIEARPEAIPQLLAPGDAVGRGEAGIDQIEDREQEQGFVGSLMRRTLSDRRRADVQIVESFDGVIEGHGR